MKKVIKKSLLVSLLLVSFTMVSMAICVPVTVDCGNGTGTNGMACGDTTGEIVEEAMDLADAFCQ
jgi:hypothetical protein